MVVTQDHAGIVPGSGIQREQQLPQARHQGGALGGRERSQEAFLVGPVLLDHPVHHLDPGGGQLDQSAAAVVLGEPGTGASTITAATAVGESITGDTG